MPADRHSSPPPASGGREVAPEEHAAAALRILLDSPRETLARALALLGQIDGERESIVDAVRGMDARLARLERGVDGVKQEIDGQEAALLKFAGAIDKLSTRVGTACELMQAGFRDQSADIDALQQQVAHVAEQGRARNSETAARLGKIEDELGEYEVPGREGRGWRVRWQKTWDDLQQRNKGLGFAIGGGAAAGAPLVYAVYRLAEFLMEALRRSGG